MDTWWTWNNMAAGCFWSLG